MYRNVPKSPGDGSDGSPPSETWLFAQAILGNPIPRIVRTHAKARAEREELRRLSQVSTRHAEGLRRLQAPQAEARHDRELLEWCAQISTEAAGKLRALRRKEAEESRAWRQADLFVESFLEGTWDPSKHPRAPKGQPDGGQWVSKGGGGGGTAPTAAASAPSEQASGKGSQDKPRNKSSQPAQSIATRTHLPADNRGSWISGTKGEGVFRYSDSPENQLAGLAGKEVRFENQHIAVGGLPPEMYYGGDAAAARVEISRVTGLDADNLAADAAMRAKLGDPTWQRPKGYVWNHAGTPGSTNMELVQEAGHGKISHKGPAAEPRAARKAAGVQGKTARAMGALTVYLTARDALQAAGVLQPDYEVDERETYHFVAGDGSVFTVKPAGLFSSAKREFVAGPRKGQSETITGAQVDDYRKQAEQEWGKYIPGSLISEPRFIPGTKRKSLPLIKYRNGIPYDAGWIDEKGVHHYSNPRPQPI